MQVPSQEQCPPDLVLPLSTIMVTIDWLLQTADASPCCNHSFNATVEH